MNVNDYMRGLQGHPEHIEIALQSGGKGTVGVLRALLKSHGPTDEVVSWLTDPQGNVTGVAIGKQGRVTKHRYLGVQGELPL